MSKAQVAQGSEFIQSCIRSLALVVCADITLPNLCCDCIRGISNVQQSRSRDQARMLKLHLKNSLRTRVASGARLPGCRGTYQSRVQLLGAASPSNQSHYGTKRQPPDAVVQPRNPRSKASARSCDVKLTYALPRFARVWLATLQASLHLSDSCGLSLPLVSSGLPQWSNWLQKCSLLSPYLVAYVHRKLLSSLSLEEARDAARDRAMPAQSPPNAQPSFELVQVPIRPLWHRYTTPGTLQ